MKKNSRNKSKPAYQEETKDVQRSEKGFAIGISKPKRERHLLTRINLDGRNRMLDGRQGFRSKGNLETLQIDMDIFLSAELQEIDRSNKIRQTSQPSRLNHPRNTQRCKVEIDKIQSEIENEQEQAATFREGLQDSLNEIQSGIAAVNESLVQV